MEIDNLDFGDFSLPIYYIYDLQTFEDKILGDKIYKNRLASQLKLISLYYSLLLQMKL